MHTRRSWYANHASQYASRLLPSSHTDGHHISCTPTHLAEGALEAHGLAVGGHSAGEWHYLHTQHIAPSGNIRSRRNKPKTSSRSGKWASQHIGPSGNIRSCSCSLDDDILDVQRPLLYLCVSIQKSRKKIEETQGKKLLVVLVNADPSTS